MSKSVRQVIIQAAIAWAFCCSYVGAAVANADVPAPSATAGSTPKPDERARTTMRTIATAPGSRARLADFFERTKGATRVISASEVWASLDAGTMKYLVVDVRPAEEFANGHIPGAVNMPITELFRPVNLFRLSESRKAIVLVCGTGHMESMAFGGLVALGFEPYALRFGMMGWGAESQIKAASSTQRAEVVHGLGAPVEK